jgi:hypothetical protein
MPITDLKKRARMTENVQLFLLPVNVRSGPRDA